MFVELIDQLRCPAAHEDTWLVLFADESRDRHILHGTLGCPVCGARYVIEGGTVWMSAGGTGPADRGPEAGTADRGPEAGAGTTVGSREVQHAVPPSPSPLPAASLAAFLDLVDPGGTVALIGSWAGAADELADMLERMELVAIAPDRPLHPMLSAIMPPSRARVPLAPGSMRAAAVDAGEHVDLVVSEAARLVRSGGRILAPASAPVPAGVREIARDASWWIGEREGGSISGIIPLAARRRAE